MNEYLLTGLAGLVAGVMNAVVGSGTLVTYPLLVGLGLPPVLANGTNTAGLSVGGWSSTWTYRRHLAGRWRPLALPLVTVCAGSILGVLLVVRLPERVFAMVVPWLIATAVVLIALQPLVARWVKKHPHHNEISDSNTLPDTPKTVAAESDAAIVDPDMGIGGQDATNASSGKAISDPGNAAASPDNEIIESGNAVVGSNTEITGHDTTFTSSGTIVSGRDLPWWSFFLGIYGGYFGAGQGVMYLALLGLRYDDDLQRTNAAKNLLGATANTVAAVVFACAATVSWGYAAALCAGSLLGGFLGGHSARRLPAWLLRACIIAIGCYAAGYLWLQ